MKFTTTEELYKVYKTHPVISKDSRNIPMGCIYFALKGDSFDGNKFASESIERGAAYAVVDNPKLADKKNCLLVEDALTALQQLANYHRKKLTIPIIGITGSNGKTTTKELISSVLSAKYKTLSTKGNYNNHIGVPLTVLEINDSHEIAVVEMGANHQGEIEFLCNICEPTHGMITNIGKAHLEGFGGVEGIKKGKSELFRFLEKTSGIVFINNDDDVLKGLSYSKTQIFYGVDKSSDCAGKLLNSHPRLSGSWNCKGKSGKISPNLYGEYNFYNILAAICIGNYFEVDSNLIDDSINSYESEMNRSQLIKKDGYTVYLDAYNANPSSVRLAIENFEKNVKGSKVVFLGDMFELGSEAEVEHRKVIEYLEKSNAISSCILVGKNFFSQKINNDRFQFFKTTEEAQKCYQRLNKINISFLIKGSRGMKMETILE